MCQIFVLSRDTPMTETGKPSGVMELTFYWREADDRENK